MEIPKHLPPTDKFEMKGDVAREQLENIDLTSTLIVPRSLTKANAKNGINRTHAAPKKDPYKGYFQSVETVRHSSGGKTHMAALPIFRNHVIKSGFTGVKQGTNIRKMGK